MRWLIIFLLAPFLAFGQGTIWKGTGLGYTRGVPDFVPGDRDGWVVVDTASGWYIWDKDCVPRTPACWKAMASWLTFTETHGAPTYTPNAILSRFAINLGDSLYVHRGSWILLTQDLSSYATLSALSDSISAVRGELGGFISYADTAALVATKADIADHVPRGELVDTSAAIRGDFPVVPDSIVRWQMLWDSATAIRGDFPTISDTATFLIADTVLVYRVNGVEIGRDTIRTSGVGGIAGSGTVNFITKFTPNGTTLGNSVVRDSAGLVSIGTNPLANTKVVIRGGGSTYATTALRVENSTGAVAIQTNDARSTGFNTTPTGAIITAKSLQEPVRNLNFIPLQTFDDSTNWTVGAGWAITGGQAVATAATGTSGAGVLLYSPAITIVPGNAYEITFTQADYSSGTATIRMGSASYAVPQYNLTTTILLLPISATGGFRITTSTYTGRFDNITVHEVANPATTLTAGQLSSSSANYGEVVIPNTTSYASGGGMKYGTGGSNSAIGLNALQNNTTGSSNSAIGVSALQNNTTGSSNSAIGVQALQNNTTGGSNSAIGLSALQNNTTGNNNSAIGVNALRANTTGSFNTAIGRDAGRYHTDNSTPNETPSNSIYIGYRTKAAGANQTNQIVIGHDAIGLGSNTTRIGNTSTTHTHLDGKLTLGSTATPGAMLDVTGEGSTPATTAFRVRNSVGVDLMAMQDGGDLIVPNVIRSQVAASINSRLALSSATFGGNGTVAIGAGAFVTAGSTYSMAIGVESAVQGTSTGSTAIGRYALVNASDAYSLGNRVINTFANSFLAGQGSGFLTNDLVKNRYANSFGIGVNTNIATLIVRGMQTFTFASITVIGDTITTSASHNRVAGEPIIIGVGVNTHFTRVKAVISSTQFTVDTAPAFASTDRFKAFVSDIVEVNDGSAGDILLRFTKFGQLSIGSASPNASAKVEIQSTTQGFLPPRMTTAQLNAIPSPALGLQMVSITDSLPYMWNGSQYIRMAADGTGTDTSGYNISMTYTLDTLKLTDGAGQLAVKIPLADSIAAVRGDIPDVGGFIEYADTATLVVTYSHLADTAAAIRADFPLVASGTYTPTATPIANVDSVTVGGFQYMRVGSTVTVSGKVSVDGTANGVLTQLRLTIPIPSDFACDCNLAGSGTVKRTAAQGAVTVHGNPTDDDVELTYVHLGTGVETIYLHFTYQIIE